MHAKELFLCAAIIVVKYYAETTNANLSDSAAVILVENIKGD